MSRPVGTVRIIDPRCEQTSDVKLAGHRKRSLSIAQSHAFLIDAERFDWSDVLVLIDDLFESAGSHGWIFFQPWSPGRQQREAGFKRSYSWVLNLTDGLLAIELNSPRVLSRGMSIMREIESECSGYWCFGSTDSFQRLISTFLAVSRDLDGAFATAVDVWPAPRAVLCLDESSRSRLLFTLTAQTARFADALVVSLKAEAQKQSLDILSSL